MRIRGSLLAIPVRVVVVVVVVRHILQVLHERVGVILLEAVAAGSRSLRVIVVGVVRMLGVVILQVVIGQLRAEVFLFIHIPVVVG